MKPKSDHTQVQMKYHDANTIGKQMQKAWNAQKTKKKGTNKRGNRQVSQQEVKENNLSISKDYPRSNTLLEPCILAPKYHHKKYSATEDKEKVKAIMNIKYLPIKVSKHIKKKIKNKEYVPPEVQLDLTVEDPSITVKSKKIEKVPISPKKVRKASMNDEKPTRSRKMPKFPNRAESRQKKRHYRSLGYPSSPSHKTDQTKVQSKKSLKSRIAKRLKKITKRAGNFINPAYRSPKNHTVKPLEGMKDSYDSLQGSKMKSPGLTSRVKTAKSSLDHEKKCLHQEFLKLDTLLREKKQASSSIMFADYLCILKTFNLVSRGPLSEEEETLVTKTWHQISFYFAGNIVTSCENIRVLITGLLGISSSNIFRKQRNSSMSYQPKVFEKHKMNLEDKTGNADSKCFKFRNKAHVRHLQNEFFGKNKKREENITKSKESLDPPKPERKKISIKVTKPQIVIQTNLDDDKDEHKIHEDIEESTENAPKPTEIPKIPAKFTIDEDLKSQNVSKSGKTLKIKSLSKQPQRLSGPGCSFPIKPTEPPALELDVYISENKMEKLIVYKQDDPEEITKLFSKKHNLPNEKETLLLNVIRDQVSKVLTCISEEDEDIE
ncbi:unnamed protein product [Moneuplotes crassus]|uniref:Uncharacterized protein n=1 Tax=Euplotes crassus TaxID=5936 RepID=A0AAD1U2E9_EUPCR|nr:unnamed protein product [Moneuplotes crassus]